MQKIVPHADARKNGFSLIEIAIVLVIIGLIIGGIFGGEILVKTAKLKHFMTKLDKYKQAASTFESKYGGIPGDFESSHAAKFNLTVRAGGRGHGDGNGLIESSTTGGSSECGESLLFWHDLADAALIDGNYAGTDGDSLASTCETAATQSDVEKLLPSAGLGQGNFIVIYGDALDNKNYLQIVAGADAIGVDGLMTHVNATPLSPIDAEFIDSKMDDGMPLTGLVTSRMVDFQITGTGVPAIATSAAPAAGVCISNVTNVYNTEPTTGGNSLACSLRFPM